MKKTAAVVLAMCALGNATAATQCFSATGAAGDVNVTISGANCNQSFAYGNGFPVGVAVFGTGQCVFTFSKPLVTSSFRLSIGDVNTTEVTSVSLDAVPYAVVPADILVTPFPGGNTTISTAAGAIVFGAGQGNGSGTVQFANGAPATATTVTLNHPTPVVGTVYSLCADDGAVVAPAVAATGIPTLSEWGLVVMSLLMAAGGYLVLRRRRMR